MENPLSNTKNSLNYTKRLLALVSLLLVFFSGLPSIAKGTVLYLEPSQGEYYQGDTFLVEARIDTEGECINTVKVDLSFSKDILEGVDFSQGNSILTLWVKEPTFSVVSCGEASVSCGLVSFIAGIPGGYCGPLPGEPGKPNLLLKIILKTINGGRSSVQFEEDSQVLLNDGFGTPAKLSFQDAVFTVLPEKAEIPKEEWQEELKKDNIPPEPFEIEIHQEPSIFDGKYFITFLTTDKQTGIDHYEIAEQRRIIGGITWKIEWKRGESPYLLEDQKLSSIIKVKVVDKAGNERIAEYLPPYKITWKDWLPWIISILLVVGVVFWIIRKFFIKTRS